MMNKEIGLFWSVMPNRADMYLYLPIYLFSMFFVIVESWILGRLIGQRKISFRSAGRIATVSTALTVFPAAWTVGWFFAVLLTLPLCSTMNYIYWGAEEIHKKYHLNQRETRN